MTPASSRAGHRASNSAASNSPPLTERSTRRDDSTVSGDPESTSHEVGLPEATGRGRGIGASLCCDSGDTELVTELVPQICGTVCGLASCIGTLVWVGLALSQAQTHPTNSTVSPAATPDALAAVALGTALTALGLL